ncbi:MAG TPA: DNA-binding domain-containing protein [Methylocella sp.]|nr:DNA-binding domain-containing protein [Methylocella sp.]
MRQDPHPFARRGFDAGAFAAALRNPDALLPAGLFAQQGQSLERRFAVYRNNVRASLIGALEARFPATRNIVGEDFFKAAARRFALEEPPHSPLMMCYGDAFPDFLAHFEPAGEVPYLADVARLEVARTRAYHAADASPLAPDVLKAIPLERLPHICFVLHPSLQIVASDYPIITIWAMNSSERELATITDWQGEDALVIRPQWEVSVRTLPPGAKRFLQGLAAGEPLGRAAETASAADESFDLPVNLAALFSGIAINYRPLHDPEPHT